MPYGIPFGSQRTVVYTKCHTIYKIDFYVDVVDRYTLEVYQMCILIHGASVNRAILQHCFFWVSNTGADAAIAILLPTLNRFSCNAAMDWSMTRFCCESVLQKR
jgi:hypothetical protein